MSDSPTAKEQASAPWSRLSTLPATNWKLVSGTLYLWATLLFACMVIWRFALSEAHSQLAVAMMDSLYVFAGVVGGVIPATMFATKRMTFKPGAPDDKRADLDMAATAQDVADATGEDPIPTASTAVPAVPAPAPVAPLVIPTPDKEPIE